MPDIDQYPDNDFIKMLYMGDSGSGKTGSLCSLAAAGYNVRVMDLDKGAQILKDYLTNPASVYKKPFPGLWTADQVKDVAKRMNYVTIQETMQNINGRAVPKGDAWNKIMAQLTEWKDGEKSYGKLEAWGPNDVLAIDSFSRYCDARVYLELVLNARATEGPQLQDYFKVQNHIERTLELLVSKAVNCHVILICHVDYIEKDDKTIRGMPQAVGKALSPKIGQHFNHTLLARSQGQGSGKKHKIVTQTTGQIDLKTAAPLKVKPEYDLETGLAEYFQAVLGRGPLPAPATPLKP